MKFAKVKLFKKNLITESLTFLINKQQTPTQLTAFLSPTCGNDVLVSRNEVCERMMRMMNELLSPIASSSITPVNAFQTNISAQHFSLQSTPSPSHIHLNHLQTLTDPTQTPSIKRTLLPLCYKESNKETRNEKISSFDEESEDDEEESEDKFEDSEETEDFEESDENIEEEEEEESEIDDTINDKIKDKDINDALCAIKNLREVEKETKEILNKQLHDISDISNDNENKQSPPSSSSSSATSGKTSDQDKEKDSASDYHRTTKMDIAVARVGKEVAQQYMKLGSIWSNATKKKHKWVNTLLETYSKLVECDPWPLKRNLARGFVLFCGKECFYPLNSIKYVIIPSLKRLSIIKRGKKLNAKTKQAMSEAVCCLRHNRNVLKKGKEKEPALLWDVQRIIDLFPEECRAKEMECSLFLVAVHTGARAVTLANVFLSDIVKVITSKQTGNLLCTLRFNRAKGILAWAHEVTIEGQENVQNNQDPIYWLSRYLKTKTNIKLSEWEAKKHTIDTKKRIWPITTASMGNRFRQRASHAGYDWNFLSFHSLRSGFICSALIKAGSSAEAKQAVLEKTALIAGWAPMHLAQMGYIKMVARRTIVSSRLVTANEQGSTGEVDETLLDLEVFHGISFKVELEKEINSVKAFNDEVKRRMKKFFEKDEVDRVERNRYESNAAKKMVEKTKLLKNMVEKKYKQINDERDSNHFYSKSRIEDKIVRLYVKDQLVNKKVEAETLAKLYCDLAEESTTKEIMMKNRRKKKQKIKEI
ncbi:uncharacterized protein MONOS_16053 [Monocercomonoides exilis]|uniref:uncharacterized protein n=1 Tax=Monocercomonoides exilis TaxID=2049356 RepID=UPI0035594FC3|nr:hypothetical protein MONOS_16053 [Monocercomonoides exilis]|eukprot:MONOS_16053.1-p1 / transcript=MONOS_16053.1 / gene=MONOS_16053 / organism=Monocercomonoides_exilis_PA203 / gene_product=unspecified product / transcript_product=unspecified product / location=Mono_scaffold01479:2908-5193(-) / protein_length=762 / sequence_SO=supercontig / SO=protein_coding / is_pseudo=false